MTRQAAGQERASEAKEEKPKPGGWVREAIDLAYGWLEQNPAVVMAMIWAVLRATAMTVKTGTTGLLFSFGRVKRVVEPGLCYMIPFLQVVRTLPTRSRTIDLPGQRVATLDGLVFAVDVNLVFRIVDIQKALVAVDDLDKAMRQVLGLCVQEVLRVRSRSDLRVSSALDEDLARVIGERLEPWGAVVLHAGFTSIRPSPKTLRLTQLALAVKQRASVAEDMIRGGLPPSLAPAMAGFPKRYVRRGTRAVNLEAKSRRERALLSSVRRELNELTEPEEHVLRRRVLVRALSTLRHGQQGRAGALRPRPQTDSSEEE